MTGGTHSQGAYAAMLFEPGAADASGDHAFDSDSDAIEFLGETLKKQGRIVGGRGIRGTLSPASERAREGAAYFAGEIHMYVSPNMINTLLTDYLGFTESTGVFTINDTLPYFGILIDRDEGVVEFVDCKVDYWILRSRAPHFQEKGEPDVLYMTLGVIASNEDTSTTWPGTPPTLGTATADTPYIYGDLDGNLTGSSGITLNGTERDVDEFVIRVNNFVKAKYTNSLTPHSLRPRNRVVQARFRLPWDSTTTDLYGMAATGQAASVMAVQGNMSMLIDLVKFQVPDTSPIVAAKDEVSLIVNGVARTSGSTKELIITNDITA